MAKKRFTDNFESLFGEPPGETHAREEGAVSGRGTDEQDQTADEEKRAGGKDFSDSLQSFLSETFEESFERQMAEREERSGASQSAPKSRRRRSSLDMLIRSTVEPSKIEVDEQSPRRRITLTFEPQKLEKLRNIARLERAMLKDIINEIVGEYIRKYETGQGKAK